MASNRARVAGAGNVSRTSSALGANDPRARRSGQGLMETGTMLQLPLTVMGSQKIGIKPAGAVEALATDASLDDVIAGFNALVESLKANGQMER